jgi:uncharacterized protein (TIGR00290 family)
MTPSPPRKTLFAWSSGKDSAMALYELLSRRDIEIVGLLTTINESAQRVAMHAVRETLLEAQAARCGLPLWKVPIPSPCSNDQYQSAMRRAIDRALAEGIDTMAFGDLFLEDIRAYREGQLSDTGIEPIFPLWERDTAALAEEMIAVGIEAYLTSVDPKVIDRSFAGRAFTKGLLADLPPHIDPCGERGEFHTFVWAAPMFSAPIPVRPGVILERDGFVFADVVAAP